MKHIALSLFAAFGFASTALAEAPKPPFIYDCDLNKGTRQHGLVKERVAFVFAKDGSVSVVDPVILHFVEGPVAGKFRLRGEKTRVSWTVKNVISRASTSIPPLNYTATITDNGKDVRVRGSVSGTAQTEYGYGSCRVITNFKGNPLKHLR